MVLPFPNDFLSYIAGKELDNMNLTEFNRETKSEILHLGCQIMGYNCKGIVSYCMNHAL